jgi:hypothetical protein
LRDIVAALQDAGYGGWFDVELMGEEIEACDYRQLLSQSQQAYQELVAVRN